MKKKNVSLSDLGKELNLSKTAVSRALRDCDDISLEIKNKVKALAIERGYVKNNLAIVFKEGKTRQIAIIFSSFYNPVFLIYCNIIYQVATELGYTILLKYCPKYKIDPKTIEEIIQERCLGILSFIEAENESINLCKSYDLSISYLGFKTDDEYVDCFYSDDYKGGSLVGDYFIKNNFSKPAYASDSFSETNIRRLNGFKSKIKNNDIRIYHSWSPFNKNELIKDIKDNKIDFLFCYSDHLAIKIKKELAKEKLITIPLIFGFDNLSGNYDVTIDCNSVQPDIYPLIKEAILNLINKSNSKSSLKISKCFDVSLIINEKNGI